MAKVIEKLIKRKDADGEEGTKKNQKSKKMEGGEDEEVQERGEPCTGKSALINH